MDITSLPPELLEAVLDFLLEDLPSIRECARVSKNWLSPCRRILFASITIYDAVWCLKGAHAFLKGSPELAGCIRAVTWDIWDEGQVSNSQGKTNAMALAISVMKRLHAVRSFTLHYHIHHVLKPYTRCSTFIRYTPVAQIHELHLLSVVFPSDAEFCGFIAHFPQLHILKILHVSWAESIQDVDLILYAPRLNALLITGHLRDALLARVLGWILASPQIPRLTKLTVVVEPTEEEIQLVNSLIARCGETLLDVMIWEHSLGVPTSILGVSALSLQPAKYLTTLNINAGSLSRLADSTQTISSPSLQHFSTLINMSSGFDSSDPSWTDIRQALNALKNLQKVSVELSDGRSRSKLFSLFPELEAKGILQKS